MKNKLIVTLLIIFCLATQVVNAEVSQVDKDKETIYKSLSDRQKQVLSSGDELFKWIDSASQKRKQIKQLEGELDVVQRKIDEYLIILRDLIKVNKAKVSKKTIAMIEDDLEEAEVYQEAMKIIKNMPNYDMRQLIKKKLKQQHSLSDAEIEVLMEKNDKKCLDLKNQIISADMEIAKEAARNIVKLRNKNLRLKEEM